MSDNAKVASWCGLMVHVVLLFMVSLLMLAPMAADAATDFEIRLKNLRRRALKMKPEAVQKMLTREKILMPAHGELTPYDKSFNELVTLVFLGQLHPEDVRVNGASLVWYAADKKLPCAMKLLASSGADLSAIHHGESLFCRVALAGDVESMKTLKSAPNDARCRAAWKGACGVMKRAAQSGDVETVKHLYRAIGDLLPYGCNYLSIIDNAGVCGNDGVIKFLVSKGLGYRKNQILLGAARGGSLAFVRQLIENEGANPHYAGVGEYTPLMLASHSGNLELVKYLVEEHKVNINAKSRLGDTALLFAARSGNEELIRYLIEKEADMAACSKGGGDFVDNVAASGNMEALIYVFSLLKKEEKAIAANNALCVAARHGHENLVEYLMNAEVSNINASHDVAVQHTYPYEDLVGASGVIEVEKTTPLMAAIASGRQSIVEMLINHGADISFSTGTGAYKLNPQRAAVRRGQPRILRMLLEKEKERLTPQRRNRKKKVEEISYVKDPVLIHQAAQNGNSACVKLLLELGWDANSVDPISGLTPIQSACRQGTDAPGSVAWNYDCGSPQSHADCVKLLLGAGADTAREKGSIAKILALHAEIPLFNCASLLWNHGDLLTPDDMHYPLHRAIECGESNWVFHLLPGRNAKSHSDNLKNPMYTLCNVGDSFQARAHHIIGNNLMVAGMRLTLDDRRELLRKGIHREFYKYIPAEPAEKPAE